MSIYQCKKYQNVGFDVGLLTYDRFKKIKFYRKPMTNNYITNIGNFFGKDFFDLDVYDNNAYEYPCNNLYCPFSCCCHMKYELNCGCSKIKLFDNDKIKLNHGHAANGNIIID